MDKKWMIVVFICIQQTGTLYAQWTKKDSVWLEDVLSGKEQIQLNPETLDAIRSGNFLNTGKPEEPELLSAPPILPISKEFTDIRPPDSTAYEDIDFSKMPPAVYALYVDEIIRRRTAIADSLNRSAAGGFTMPELRDKDRIQIGNSPLSVAAGAENIYNENVKDGQRRGGFTGRVRYTFSLNDILMGIFSKTERAKRRNRKKANAWKIYNDYPEHLEWRNNEKP